MQESGPRSTAARHAASVRVLRGVMARSLPHGRASRMRARLEDDVVQEEVR